MLRRTEWVNGIKRSTDTCASTLFQHQFHLAQCGDKAHVALMTPLLLCYMDTKNNPVTSSAFLVRTFRILFIQDNRFNPLCFKMKLCGSFNRCLNRIVLLAMFPAKDTCPIRCSNAPTTESFDENISRIVYYYYCKTDSNKTVGHL